MVRLALVLVLLVLGFVLLCKGLFDCWGSWCGFTDTSYCFEIISRVCRWANQLNVGVVPLFFTSMIRSRTGRRLR